MSRPIPRVRRRILSTDEGYQRNIEAYVGNFTAKMTASNLLTLNGLFVLEPFAWSVRAQKIQETSFPRVVFHSQTRQFQMLIRAFCNSVSDEIWLEVSNPLNPSGCSLISRFCCYRDQLEPFRSVRARIQEIHNHCHGRLFQA